MPRVVLFHLTSGTVEEVERALAEAGFFPPHGAGDSWLYPNAEDAVLYTSADSKYDWMQAELEEEYREVVAALQGQAPVVCVFSEVSSRHPGDAEVRMLARLVLSRFGGCGFDEYMPEHGWTLEEIERDARVDGFRFFDYQARNDARHRVRWPR